MFEDYISSIDLKPGTILDYSKSMKQTFGRYLNRHITDITREIILKTYKKRIKQSVSRANNAMPVFRALYNYQRAVRRLDDGSYLMPENPVSVLKETKVIFKYLMNHNLSEAQDIKARYVMVDIDRIRDASQKITNRILEFSGK